MDVTRRTAIEKNIIAYLTSWKELLASWSSAIDVVAHCCSLLENDELLNAWKWSVLTAQGTIEMDAAIMNWTTKQCGAIAWVSTIKNPILWAKAIMDTSHHVMLIWPWKKTYIDHSWILWDKKFGTVWVVAYDTQWNIAVATSTGWVVNKQCGRVWDSPLLWAWSYADSSYAWISCTWMWEWFMRSVFAKSIIASMEYWWNSFEKAWEEMIHTLIDEFNWLWWFIGISANKTIVSKCTVPWMVMWYTSAQTESIVEFEQDITHKFD